MEILQSSNLPPSEKLASLGIMEAQLSGSPKTQQTSKTHWYRGVQGGPSMRPPITADANFPRAVGRVASFGHNSTVMFRNVSVRHIIVQWQQDKNDKEAREECYAVF